MHDRHERQRSTWYLTSLLAATPRSNAVLQAINEIFPHAGSKVVYGEMSRLGASRLAAEGITFKQIPYDVKMR